MKLRNLLPIFLCLCVFALTSPAQPRLLKVMVLCDMEGVSGATDYKKVNFIHSADYAEGRKSLTADVNAAIAGLKAGGATEIVIVDGHGSGNSTGPDVLEDQLLAPAKVMYRDSSFDIYMDSYDHSFDAIVAIGMHAGAGNQVGFLAHTYTSIDTEYKVNGVPFNESMILAAGAARLKIPVIMVSGDDQLEKEIRRAMPWVKYASVKHAVDRSKAESFRPEEVAKRIETAAREAIANLSAARLPEWEGPFRFALTFQDEGQARNAALAQGAELLANGLSVQVRANDFEDGYRQSIRLISLAGIVSRGDLRLSVVNDQPNAPDLRTAITDRSYDRFLHRAPAPAASSTPRRRYWGAN